MQQSSYTSQSFSHGGCKKTTCLFNYDGQGVRVRTRIAQMQGLRQSVGAQPERLLRMFDEVGSATDDSRIVVGMDCKIENNEKQCKTTFQNTSDGNLFPIQNKNTRIIFIIRINLLVLVWCVDRMKSKSAKGLLKTNVHSMSTSRQQVNARTVLLFLLLQPLLLRELRLARESSAVLSELLNHFATRQLLHTNNTNSIK